MAVTPATPTPSSRLYPNFLLWVIVLVLIIVGVGGIGATFFQHYSDKIYQGVTIDTMPVGGMTKEQALQALEARITTLPQSEIVLKVDTISVASTSAQLGIHRNYQAAVESAYALGHQGSFFTRLKTIFETRWNQVSIMSPLEFDPALVSNLVTALKAKVDTPSQEPTATLGVTNNPATIVISRGTVGRAVDEALLTNNILSQANAEVMAVAIPVASVGAELTPQQSDEFQAQAKAFVGKKAVFSFKSEQINLKLNDQELVKLLTYPVQDSPSPTKLASILSEWETIVTRPPQDAEFNYDPTTLKVTTFKPHRNGLTLDRIKTQDQIKTIIQAIYQEQVTQATPEKIITNDLNISAEKKTVYEETLALQTTKPTKTLESTNNLGIKELVGFGESEYAHSISSRIHNVALAAQKIDFHIIRPGEEFSFNRALGDVSRATGFQPAYVIRSGQTVLGDGGGVCQVSTTLFRSVLNAGLKVTKRKAHSYRVSYYELDQKPGIDATVYSGEVDLRFINDTGHHLLINTSTDSQRLYMKIELYGTSDGRQTQIVDHKTWDYRSPPAPVYIPDPSLPPGKVKQIDWSASGIKASFKNIIKDKNGNLIREEEYYSNYVPWSAKYLRGV